MKKIIVFTLIINLVICSMFCKKPPSSGNKYDNDILNPTVISATNIENGNSDIVSVIAIILNEDKNKDWDIIASGRYENNGFYLKLPSFLSTNYLDEFFDLETMSDSNAKCAVIDDIIGLDSKGEPIGSFVLGDGSYDGNAKYIYADRNFTSKRNDNYQGNTYKETYESDCNLKKGWNIMYEYAIKSTNETISIYRWITTTQKPSDINFNWRFHSYDDN